jgi:hypothetical protein
VISQGDDNEGNVNKMCGVVVSSWSGSMWALCWVGSVEFVSILLAKRVVHASAQAGLGNSLLCGLTTPTWVNWRGTI